MAELEVILFLLLKIYRFHQLITLTARIGAWCNKIKTRKHLSKGNRYNKDI